MTASETNAPDVFAGPDKMYADRLLAYCLSKRTDPERNTFITAVWILRAMSGSVRVCAFIPVEHRVERDELLCSTALRLAELAL